MTNSRPSLEEVTTSRNAAAFAVNEEAKANIIAAGGEVRQLSAEQRQEWVDAMKPVWAQFEGDCGPGQHRRRASAELGQLS